MVEPTVNGLIERKDFSKIRANIDIPDLIEIQKRSYEQFLQLESDPDRRDQGRSRHHEEEARGERRQSRGEVAASFGRGW